jgi:N-acetylmuramoyl-L-alanine amidase
VGEEVGYVHNAYLQLEKPSATQPPVTPTPTPIPVPVPTPKPPVVSPSTLSDLVVIIDPGHGGSDSGSLGFGLQEKNVVLNVSRHMNSYFEKTPIKSLMTRTDDSFITVSARPIFAAKNKGDVFVSVHANGSETNASGQESFYYAKTASTNPYVNQSRALTTYMQNRMQETWDLRNRGVKQGNFGVIRENTMPATLIEMGFINTAKDNAFMQSEIEREKMGKALFLATLDYFYHYNGRKDVLPLYKQFGATPSNKLH